MKKTIKIILYTLIIVNLVGFIVFFKGNSQTAATNKNPSMAQQNPSPSVSQKVSSSGLSSHNSKENCWIAYEGKVYDITSWLPRHPGSAEAIAPFCGTSSEFQAAFTGQHGTSQVKKLMEEGIYKGDLQ